MADPEPTPEPAVRPPTPLPGRERSSLRDLLPELQDPTLAHDLSSALTQGVVRLALVSVVSVLGFVVVLWLDPRWGGWADRIGQALRMGLPLGFTVALTPLAELWVAQGRRRLSGAGLAYLGGALGVALAVFQIVYAIRLGQTQSPSHALHATWTAVDAARLRAGAMLLLLPLTHVGAWWLRTGLHRQPGAARWVSLALYGLATAATPTLTDLPAWMPLFLFAVLPPLFNLDYWGADRVLARLRGERDDDAAAPATPLPPLPRLDRIIVGGAGFLPASLGWLIAAGALGLLGEPWHALWLLPGWLLHVFVAAGYAGLLNRRRRFAQAELVARHRLADPLAKAKAQRRNDTLHLVWALCGQGQLAEARERLPEALTADDAPGFSEQARRYQLAQAFSAAGDPAVCLEILDTVRAWRSARMQALQISQRVVALDQLGRPAEAQALTETWDTRAAGPQGAAIRLNNLAAFELHKPEPDVARALAWARAAAETRWGPVPALRGTLGAALLAAGQAGDALPHLEVAAAALAVPGASPHSVAWTRLALGDALRALGRDDDARASYAIAAEVRVDCRPRRDAAARLSAP